MIGLLGDRKVDVSKLGPRIVSCVVGCRQEPLLNIVPLYPRLIYRFSQA